MPMNAYCTGCARNYDHGFNGPGTVSFLEQLWAHPRGEPLTASLRAEAQRYGLYRDHTTYADPNGAARTMALTNAQILDDLRFRAPTVLNVQPGRHCRGEARTDYATIPPSAAWKPVPWTLENPLPEGMECAAYSPAGSAPAQPPVCPEAAEQGL